MKSPFPLAPYKGKKAIGHIIQKEKAREACGGIEEGDERGGGKKKLSEYFAVFHISSLSTVPLSMAATPPVTSHIAIQEFFLGLPFFGKVRRWGV